MARSFARLGGTATLVSAVGRDGWGSRLVEAVRAEGVTVRPVKGAGESGRLLALVGVDGERTFVTERGATDGIRAADLRPSWFRGVGALHVPAYGLILDEPYAAARRAVELLRDDATAGRALVSVDLASYGPLRDLGVAVAKRRVASLGPDVLFANRREASTLTGRRAHFDAAARPRARGRGQGGGRWVPGPAAQRLRGRQAGGGDGARHGSRHDRRGRCVRGGLPAGPHGQRLPAG